MLVLCAATVVAIAAVFGGAVVVAPVVIVTAAGVAAASAVAVVFTKAGCAGVPSCYFWVCLCGFVCVRWGGGVFVWVCVCGGGGVYVRGGGMCVCGGGGGGCVCAGGGGGGMCVYMIRVCSWVLTDLTVTCTRSAVCSAHCSALCIQAAERGCCLRYPRFYLQPLCSRS